MRLTHLLTAAATVVGLLAGPAVSASPPTAGALPAAQVLTAPTIQEGDLAFRVQRLGGTNRYAVAAAISRRFVPAGAPVVYVTSGGRFAEALTAGPAASRTRGPVLFVSSTSIPSATATELTRLRPGRIVVVGDTTAVSAAVRTALDAYTTGPVDRIASTTPYATSAAVSRAAFPAGATTAYVVNGDNYPDGLSAGAAAVVQDAPLLLTSPTTLPSAVLTELQRLAPTRIIVVGGTSSVSETVLTRLRTVAPTERVAGTDRYATSLAVSKRVFGTARPGVQLASGTVFTDALAGAAAAEYTRGPTLVVRSTGLPAGHGAELDRLTPRTAYVLGGVGTLSIEVPKAAQRERGVCWAGRDYTTGTKQVVSTISGTTSRKLAFTLDMGGRLEGATQIVDFLVANQVCTTFFPTSIMASTTEGRRVMARIAAHPELFEIGNHTVHHCDLVLGGGGSPTAAPCDRAMTSTFVRAELTDAETVLRNLTGLSTKPYWRPPYGSHNTFVRDNAAAVGYPITVMWNRDTIDWATSTTTAQIVSRTTSPLPPSGTIVLAHLGGFNTGAALPRIVEVLRANGYTMTTVSDMRDG